MNITAQRGNALPIIIIVIAIGFIAVSQFSKSFGLSLSVGWEVLKTFVPALVVWGMIWFYLDEVFDVIWPFAPPTLTMCWWPAFNHWAGRVTDGSAFEIPAEHLPWYGTDVGQWGLCAALLAAGYGLRYWWKN